MADETDGLLECFFIYLPIDTKYADCDTVAFTQLMIHGNIDEKVIDNACRSF